MIYVLSILLSLNLMAADDHSSHHSDAKEPSAQLQLNNGKKWETDAPMRNAMEKIKAEMTAQLDSIHQNKLSKSDYTKLGGKLNDHVQFIFKNCKLAPEADKQAHFMLTGLMSGIHKMKTGADNERQQGAVQVIKALGDYNKFFDHPGWKDITH